MFSITELSTTAAPVTLISAWFDNGKSIKLRIRHKENTTVLDTIFTENDS
jgi:hypothetical protein